MSPPWTSPTILSRATCPALDGCRRVEAPFLRFRLPNSRRLQPSRGSPFASPRLPVSLVDGRYHHPSCPLAPPTGHLPGSSSEFRVPSSEFRVPSSEFRVPSSEFRVPSSEFRVPSSEFRVPSSEFRVPSSEFRVPSSEFRVPSSEFRVPSSEFRVPSSEFRVPSSEL